MQEMLHRYFSNPKNPPSCTESAAGEVRLVKAHSNLCVTKLCLQHLEEDRIMAQVANLQQLLPLREFELESDRMRAKAEHLRAQCEVLALALDESRVLSERLMLLCGRFFLMNSLAYIKMFLALGKYESNCTALWISLEYSDTAIESYDVLLALLESELAALVATCTAAGIPAASHCPAVNLAGDPDNPGLALARAGDLRMTAEGVACLLLSRLDRSLDVMSYDGSSRSHS